MARRTKEEAQRTRERILDAAIEVFHERGVAAPSLSDVAALADVTRGAVYGHFRNKSDVFSALCDRVRLPMEAACAPLSTKQCDDPLGTLQTGWINFFRFTANDEQQRKILTIVIHRCELIDASDAIVKRVRRGREDGLAHMAKMIEMAVEHGQLPENLDRALALRFFHGTLTGLLSNWLLDPEAFDLAKVATRTVTVLGETLRNCFTLQAEPQA